MIFTLLDLGCGIIGTIMRQQWVPLSYGDGSKSQSSSGNSDNKDDSFPNKPKDISKIGFKDSFHMETEWKGGKNTAVRKLGCVGYRSGTGTSVSINTRNGRP